MANLILQQGDTDLLDTIRVAATCLQDVRLFKNNHVPAVTDVNASYVEADFSGYASVGLGTWNAAYVNANGQGEIDAALATFTHNGGMTANTVYGAYVTNAAGDVIYAERFAAPVLMQNNGDSIPYLCRFTLVSA